MLFSLTGINRPVLADLFDHVDTTALSDPTLQVLVNHEAKRQNLSQRCKSKAVSNWPLHPTVKRLNR
jgi:hypothetical protein